MTQQLKILLTVYFLIGSNITVAQTGTYFISFKTGASCTIAVAQKGNKINADIFAWWHTPSGRNGAFSGEGILKNNLSILQTTDTGIDDNGACRVTMNFAPGLLKVKYAGCEPFNLMADFSGTYKKLSDHTPGSYAVSTDKCYFYKKASMATRLKTYLVKGNQVEVDIENVMDKDWVFVNYEGAKGKTTSGYMRWGELKGL